MSFDKKADLTDREKSVLAHAWAFMLNTPNLDQDKLAEALGYTNPRSIYPVLKSAKDKLAKARNASPEDGAGPSTPSKTRTKGAGTPAGRKRKTNAGDAENSSASTPSKGAKRGKQGSTSQAQGGAGEDPVVIYDNDALEDGEA